MLSKVLSAALAAALLVPGAAAGEPQKKKKDSNSKSSQSSKQAKSAKPANQSWQQMAARSNAQDLGPQRIEFGPGTMSASLNGRVEARKSREYLLAGKAGQSVTLRIIGHGSTKPSFVVSGPGEAEIGAPSSIRNYEVTPPRPAAAAWILQDTGDFLISVTEITGRPSTFTLVVDIH